MPLSGAGLAYSVRNLSQDSMEEGNIFERKRIMMIKALIQGFMSQTIAFYFEVLFLLPCSCLSVYDPIIFCHALLLSNSGGCSLLSFLLKKA